MKILHSLALASLILALGALCSCSMHPQDPGGPGVTVGGPVDIAATAAASALAAYQQARNSGLDRDAALRSAENAAVTAAIALVPGSFDAQWRPFVTAALAVLAGELDRGKAAAAPTLWPSGASVREAVEYAVRDAQGKR